MSSLSNIDIQSILEEFPCPVALETGTHFGNGVKHLAKFPFKRILSVEINEGQARKMAQEFKDDPRIEIGGGKSVTFLEKMLPAIDDDILFWLDSHYPSSDLGLAPYDSEKDDDVRLPLEIELHLIKNLTRGKRPVILIDDLWIYRDYDKLTRNELKPRKPFSSKHFYKEIFADTHDCKVVEECEIYAVLTPKV